jgi:ribosomal protein S18 acetylase RimI-like enzyme
MKKHDKAIWFMIASFAILMFSGKVHGQDRPVVHSWEELAEYAKKDTTKPKIEPRIKIKSYSSVITEDFVTAKGLFTAHKSKSKDIIYFEIPDSILHRDIMVINRLLKSPGNSGMYPGEELDERTIQFEPGPDSTIRIRFDLVISQADSTDAIYKAVVNANLNPIVASFPIEAFGNGHRSYVINVTQFLKDKNFVNSIGPNTQLAKSINPASIKDNHIDYIHTYPINVEIGSTKNVDPKGNGPGGTADASTIETNTSFIELPAEPMRRRFFDPRVGYFADAYNAFSDNQQKSELRTFILRWRLEPREQDVEKWKRGELVEPKKPIVIYIDPATPKQWRPYLILGINDWQKAFEQAGFKNAIIGREWPEGDTTMHMDDARYSMLNYFPSEIENAYGPQVHDPRSGEIIQTHIGWYHNVMSLLHDWYQVQAGAVDPDARKPKFDDRLMGELIRFVSSHEVGHTLGLRHNFGSSSKTPVDSLRSKRYLDIHGHTASIMDYARFNYVAQPEDHIPERDLFPRIGEYDKWAIEWGYKFVGGKNADEDKLLLGSQVAPRITQNPLLWFGDGETKKFDPRCQTEDLGDDAVKASTYGIKNLKRILPNLPQWTKEYDDLGDNLTNMYKQVQLQYFRYMSHVLKNVGGVHYDIKTDDQPGAALTLVPREMQQRTLSFFNSELFTTPLWLMNKQVLSRTSLPAEPNFIEDTQVKVLNSLMDVGKINQLLGEYKQFGNKSLPADDYIKTIHRYIWRELSAKGLVKIDSYRRNLQKSYFQNLLVIVSGKDEANAETDAGSMVRADLAVLKKEIRQALPRVDDPLTLYHLQDLENRIQQLTRSRENASL